MTKQFVNEKEDKQFSCCLESSSPCRKNYRQHLNFYHSYVTLNCHLWKNSMQQPNWFCSLSLYNNYLSIVRMHERIYCQKCAGNLGYPIKKIFLWGLFFSFSEKIFWYLIFWYFDIFLIMKGFCQQNITLIIWYSQLNRRQQEGKKPTDDWVVFISVSPGIFIVDGSIFVRLLLLHDKSIVFICLAAWLKQSSWFSY